MFLICTPLDKSLNVNQIHHYAIVVLPQQFTIRVVGLDVPFKHQRLILMGLMKDSFGKDGPHTFLPTQVPDFDRNQLALITDQGQRGDEWNRSRTAPCHT